MARLDDKCKSDLGRKDFEQYPVWVWDDEERHHCPIDEVVPDLSDYGGTAFVKARFAAGCLEFDGYLVGGSAFFAFALFVGERKFLFNINVPDMIEEDMSELCQALGVVSFSLFPLHFESDVYFKNGGRIAGEFALK
ncbi:MAG: hypothetical protein PHU85_18440 [Phycisphaerae bacterium]|nr:hypothetical protein [Phycisphaerae bacterium]